MLYKQLATEDADQESLAQKLLLLEQQVAEDKQKGIEAGGLYVIGTERHESRRIDNQLRGRSGRQGDPGRTKFFLSLEDDLLRIFGSDKVISLFPKLGMKEDEALTHPWLSSVIEKSQKKVENHHYDVRKNLLKFDNVMNEQRSIVYEQRVDIMEAEDIKDVIEDIRTQINEELVAKHVPPYSYLEKWNLKGLFEQLRRLYFVDFPLEEWSHEDGVDGAVILERINIAVVQLYEEIENMYGTENIRGAEKQVLLSALDDLWKDHLLSLDHLRQSINLRAYGQKDPLNEYKHEAFLLFETMMLKLREITISRLYHLKTINPQNMLDMIEEKRAAAANKSLTHLHPDSYNLGEEEHVSQATGTETRPKISRNSPCYCGSGKKYKHCHGKTKG
jgi:preprotein translocase subunit SecA